jgi:hypothetical protein
VVGIRAWDILESGRTHTRRRTCLHRRPRTHGSKRLPSTIDSWCLV